MKRRIFTPKTANPFFVMTILSVLLTLPISAFAQAGDDVAQLRRIGRTFAAIAEKASPAVVVLKVEASVREERSEIRRPSRFSPDGDRIIPQRQLRVDQPTVWAGRLDKRRRSTGLGFIVSEDGYILTNHHVVDRATKVAAELTDGRQLKVKIIGADPTTDVAVLKIDADDLAALELGDSDSLQAGDWVVGIVNSMGMGRTFSAGLVTAKGRSGLGIATIEEFIQTDLNMHLGDGGGPLLDLEGKVVGINAAVVGRQGGPGISLAIPANMAKFAYEQIVETGAVERGFLGVAFTDLTPKMAEALGLETTTGAVVTEVIADSAAAKAGVEKHDVITELNDIPIEFGPQLLHIVASLRPGEEVEVVVIRNGKRRTLTVTLGKRPSPEELKTDED
jgi:serine protease Do